MIYKLYDSSLNDKNNVIETILLNRKIENPEVYLNLDESCCDSYEKLDNIAEAVECFARHFEGGDLVAVLIDCDP